MTGSNDSVIGVDKGIIVNRFRELEKETFAYPEDGPAWLNAIVCTLDAKTGKCLEIKRLTETCTIQ